jgi:phenylacetate-CoA ligase
MKNIPPLEQQPPDVILRFQENAVRDLVLYAAERSPFYKKHLANARVNPQAITTLQDFQAIPPTTKDDFHPYNWDFLCVPKSNIVEYTSTSGTTGKPVTVALTEKDLERLAYNECISFACADGTANDLYQLMLTLDRQFMAGIAYYEGIRKLGAGLIRVGPGLPAMQWETIERLRPTAIVSVPTFIVKLIEFAKKEGIDLNQSSVRRALCIGESIRLPDLKLNTLGNKITDAWNIQLYGTYAATEMQTAFTECGHARGGHLHPELLFLEVLDENNKPLPPGTPGEITVTTLGVEGMPLIRYKTGDIAQYYNDPCPCGRTTPRLGPILGRRQQLIKLKGTTIYPPGIFEILQQAGHLQDYVVEVFTGNLGTDELKLYIATEPARAAQVQADLRASFQSRLRVIPDIQILSTHELEQMQLAGQSRKSRKFIDTRK